MIRPSRFRRRQLTPDSLAATLATLFPLFYFFRAVIGQIVLCPDDGLLFNVPLRVTAAKMFLQGQLPLWNPYIFSGMPLFGSAQGGLLFPLNWFYLVFDGPTATNMMVISTYMLAGLGAYLYSRRSGSGIAGSLVTSLVWQCGSFLVAQISHINIVQVAAMLPWIFWAVEGYGATGRPRWGILLAVFVALQAFVGHPQTLCYSILLVTAYAIVMGITDRPARKRYLRALAFIAAGLMLAAVQMLPTLELLRNSPREQVTYDFFTSFSMPRRFIQTFLAPYILGGGDGRVFRVPYSSLPFYAEYIGYVGLLTLMLASLALLIKRDRRNLFWAITAGSCLLLALGANVPFGVSRLIYYVPVLNLFRVPARHVMEINFALAVLAGRGVTLLAQHRREAWVVRRTFLIAAGFVILTCLAVTWGRPPEFRLGREAPITFLRAPELFVPVAIAFVSGIALWIYVRGRFRGAALLLLGILALDLGLWGQSSGWRVNTGPAPGSEYWTGPEVVGVFRPQANLTTGTSRILTVPHSFAPDRIPVPPSISRSTDWVLWTQPNIYMMHGVENAAGYDGFGVARYGRLAGDMKVWGELTDPNRALRGPGREIDLLNVRYLLSMRRMPQAPDIANAPAGFESATEKFGNHLFAPNDLRIPYLNAKQRLLFSVPPVTADRVTMITNLAWSQDVPTDTVVAHLLLTTSDGKTLELPLRAGVETAEWSYDRPDIRANIRHNRAPVAGSYSAKDGQTEYEAHSYIASLALPEKATIVSGEIRLEGFAQWPKLTMSVQRLSLVNGDVIYPLRSEWMQVRERSAAERVEQGPDQFLGKSDGRWLLMGQTRWVDVYENSRVLPRGWLAEGEIVLNSEQALDTIRRGKLPNGQAWDPLKTAIVEAPSGIAFGLDHSTTRRAEITLHEPNSVEVKTVAEGPSLLILSENYYPGWQAKVDGREAQILRVNYNLRGLALEAGEHKVEFFYRPRSVIVGGFISLLALAGLLVWSRRR